MDDEKKSRVQQVKSAAEFEAALKSAPGSVLVDFISKGCGACEEELPALEKLAAEKCAGDCTILVAEESQVGGELLDKFEVEGTPTLFYAKAAQDVLDAKLDALEEVDVPTARRRLKCAR